MQQMSIILVHVLVVLMILSMGFFVFKADPKSKVHRIFALNCLNISIWMVAAFLGLFVFSNYDFALFSVRLAWAISIFGTPLWAAFFHYFPRPLITLGKGVKMGIAFVAVILFGLVLFTPLMEKALVFENGRFAAEIFGPMVGVFWFWFLFWLVCAIALAVYKAVKMKGFARGRLLMSLSGFLFFICISTFSGGVLPLFDVFIYKEQSMIFSFLWVMPMFYSIQKHRFFHLSNLSLNFLRLLIVLTVFFFVSLISFWALLIFIDPELLAFATVLSLFIGLCVAVLLISIFPEMRSNNMRHFYDVIDEFRGKLSFPLSLQRLQKLVEKAFVLELNIKEARILPVSSDKLGKEFVRMMEKYKGRFLAYDEIWLKLRGKEKGVLSHAMLKFNAAFCFPIFEGEKLRALFFLGHKVRADFSKEEVEEFKKLVKLISYSEKT